MDGERVDDRSAGAGTTSVAGSVLGAFGCVGLACIWVSGRPGGAVVGHAEGVESGKVDCCCPGNEIGEDSFESSCAGFASAMDLAGEMTYLRSTFGR
jgi:hypothetical protein